MKKIILIALACTACLAMFGCQDNTTSQNESTTQIQTTAVVTENVTEKATKAEDRFTCTASIAGGHNFVMVDDRVETLYDFITKTKNESFAENSTDLSKGDVPIDLMFFKYGKYEYYSVFKNDTVYSSDNEEFSNKKYYGYSDGIYDTINKTIAVG